MNRTTSITLFLTALLTSLLCACADRAIGPTSGSSRQPPPLTFGDHARVGKYVSMGTSLSMGVMSNGVVSADQSRSWPAQLAELAGVPFSQPLIQAPGCSHHSVRPLRHSDA